MMMIYQSIYIRRWNSEIGQIPKDETHIFRIGFSASFHFLLFSFFLFFFFFFIFFYFIFFLHLLYPYLLTPSCFSLHFATILSQQKIEKQGGTLSMMVIGSSLSS